jgi:hypothetical protein
VLGEIRMSIMPDYWFNRFWPLRESGSTTGYFDDIMKGVDDMRREI